MRINRLAALAIMAVASLAGRNARADGVADILIDPAAGITISVPGSYRLAGNVTMTANANAVTVNANDVTLDLNGHTITGAAGNTSLGISAPAVSDVTVMNGGLADFGNSAVVIATRGTLHGLTVRNCADSGTAAAVFLSSEGRITDCHVSETTPATGSVTAITVGVNGSVTRNTIAIVTSASSATAISAGANSSVTGNIISDVTSATSAATGISAGHGSTITENVIADNSGIGGCVGIAALSRCIIRDNSVTNNNCTGTGDALGISASNGSVITGNTCTNQTTGTAGTGIAKGIGATASIIENNTCSDNGAGVGSNGTAIGIDGGSGGVVRGNLCTGNKGVGTGTSCGISVTSGCRVETNHCRANTGGAASHGIRATNVVNLIAGNSTAGHTSAGFIFLSNTGNRCHSNQCYESEVIESTAPGVAPASLGTGDLANVLY